MLRSSAAHLPEKGTSVRSNIPVLLDRHVQPITKSFLLEAGN